MRERTSRPAGGGRTPRLAAIGLLATVALAVIVVLHASITQRHSASMWAEALERADELLTAQNLRFRVEQKIATSRAYLLTGHESLLGELVEERDRFHASLDALRRAPGGAGRHEILDRIAAREAEHEARLRALLAELPELRPSEVSSRFSRELKPVRDALDAELRSLHDDLLADAVGRRDDAVSMARQSEVVAVAGAALVLVMGGTICWLVVGLIRIAHVREAGARAELVERELQTRELEQHARMFAILEALPAGVFVLRADGSPFYANGRARALLGRELAPDVDAPRLTQHYRAFVAGTDEIYPSDRTPIVRALQGERSIVSDMEIERHDGRLALQVEARPVFAPDGRLEYAVAAFIDVETLRRQALEDPLTGLLNRTAFEQCFTHARGTCARTERPLCVALLDLDHFKRVNDVHGHASGDEVLQRVSSTLVASVRSADVVARWGGEEIALLLPVTAPHGAVHLVERLLERVAALLFIGRDGLPFHVAFSAGVAQVGPTDRTLADVVRRADTALYAAKAAGRARVHCDGDEVRRAS